MSVGQNPAGGRPIIVDGGTGSELRRRGVQFLTGSWSAIANLEQTPVLQQIHRDFVEAGADIVTANTFATSRFVLAADGLDDRFIEINQAAIDAARHASDRASRDVVLAASLSCMPPSFDRSAYPDSRLEYAAYVELAELFATSGVELVLLEMMQHPEHARLACRAVQASGLPFWIGVSLRQATTQEPGSTIPRLVAFDDEAQPADGILDCAVSFEPSGIAIMHSPVDAIEPALTMLRHRWHGPFGAYAEIPYPEDPESDARSRLAADSYARHAAGWLDTGAELIGGCCGTMPAHIAKLKRLTEAR